PSDPPSPSPAFQKEEAAVAGTSAARPLSGADEAPTPLQRRAVTRVSCGVGQNDFQNCIAAERPSSAAGPAGKKSCHEKPFYRPRLLQRLVPRLVRLTRSLTPQQPQGEAPG